MIDATALKIYSLRERPELEPDFERLAAATRWAALSARERIARSRSATAAPGRDERVGVWGPYRGPH